MAAVGSAREDTNELCDAAMETLVSDVSCQTSVAIIVAGQFDTVATLGRNHGLPDDLPVLSANDPRAQLKANFPAMVETGPDMSLMQAAVSYADSPNEFPQAYHTGSIAEGTWESMFANCQDWTSGSNAGYAGTPVFDPETQATRWLNRGPTHPCSDHTELLCACW